MCIPSTIKEHQKEFACSLYREHLEEASFIYDQRTSLLNDPNFLWTDIEDFENRFEAHIDGLVIGQDLSRHDGIEPGTPGTVSKLEWIAVHGKVIEEYPERERILLYASLQEDDLPVHIVVDYAYPEEPVIVTAYVPESRYLIKYQIRKKQTDAGKR